MICWYFRLNTSLSLVSPDITHSPPLRDPILASTGPRGRYYGSWSDADHRARDEISVRTRLCYLLLLLGSSFTHIISRSQNATQRLFLGKLKFSGPFCWVLRWAMSWSPQQWCRSLGLLSQILCDCWLVLVLIIIILHCARVVPPSSSHSSSKSSSSSPLYSPHYRRYQPWFLQPQYRRFDKSGDTQLSSVTNSG